MGLFSKKSSSRNNSVSSEGALGKLGRKGSQTSVVSTPTLLSPMPGSNPSLPTIPSVELPPAPDPAFDPSGYLRSIYAVRERSKFVLEAALKDRLTNFTVDMSKFSVVADYVVSIIKVGGRLSPEDGCDDC